MGGDFGDSKEKGSFSSAFFNFFKSLVGIGVLALPTAFSNSGWLAGSILLPLCAVGMLFVSNQLMKISDKLDSKAKNLVEFVRETTPSKFIASVNISLFAFQIGICISYTIFFITYIQKSFCQITDGFLCDSNIASIFVSLCLLIPLMFIRDLSKLKIWSLIGNCVSVTSLTIVSINCIMHLSDSGLAETQPINMSSIGNSIGVFIFTFEGIGLYFSVRHSMAEPSRFTQVLNLAIGVGITIYVIIGLLGYLAYGNTVNDIIIFQFGDDNIPMQIVQVAYCFSLILSYPIQIFPCVNVVDLKISNMLAGRKFRTFSHSSFSENLEPDEAISEESTNKTPLLMQQGSMKKYKLYTSLTRLGFVFFTFLIGSVFDKVSDFISLTGCVCGIFLCYVVPVIIIHYQDKGITASHKYLNYFIVSISVGFGLYGLYSTIIKIGEDFF